MSVVNASSSIRPLENRSLAPRSRCSVVLASDMRWVILISLRKLKISFTVDVSVSGWVVGGRFSVRGRGGNSAGYQGGREVVGGLSVARFLIFCCRASLC